MNLLPETIGKNKNKNFSQNSRLNQRRRKKNPPPCYLVRFINQEQIKSEEKSTPSQTKGHHVSPGFLPAWRGQVLRCASGLVCVCVVYSETEQMICSCVLDIYKVRMSGPGLCFSVNTCLYLYCSLIFSLPRSFWI